MSDSKEKNQMAQSKEQETAADTSIFFSYRLQANVFVLDMKYCDEQLTIKLVDISSGHTYSRKFTKNDVNSKVIHPQEDLLEIFCNIVSKDHLQQMNEGISTLQTDFLEGNYPLGSLIDRGGRGFSVWQDGVIETKRTGPPKTIKYQKPDVYVTKLVLRKQSQLDERAIMDIKLGEIRRQFFNQIKSLKKQIHQLKYGPNKKYKPLSLSDQEMVADDDLYTAVKNENNQIKHQLQLYKQANPLQIDFRSPYISKFSFEGKKIQYKGQNTSYTQILRVLSISKHDKSSFKIRIQLTNEKRIMVGIVDRKSSFNNRYSSNSGHAYAYYGYNGYRYPNGGSQGPGMKTGDVIEVVINPIQGQITWIINYDQFKTTLSVEKEILTSSQKQFVPYAELYNVNDCIKFVDQEEMVQS